MGVRTIAIAHQFDCGSKGVIAFKDFGVLSEEAEDQPGHEMVHVVAALRRAPFRIGAQKLDIKFVQSSGRLDIEGALADLLNCADPSER